MTKFITNFHYPSYGRSSRRLRTERMPVTYGAHAGYVRSACRLRTERMPVTYGAYAGYVRSACRLRTNHTLIADGLYAYPKRAIAPSATSNRFVRNERFQKYIPFYYNDPCCFLVDIEKEGFPRTPLKFG